MVFDIGYMDTPFTIDEATGSNDIMFVGRGSIQTAAVFSPMISGRRWACARTTTATRPGYYATGPQSGATHGTGEQFGAFGCATYQVLQAPDYSFHFGGDVGALLKPPEVGGIRTITLSDRPGIRAIRPRSG